MKKMLKKLAAMTMAMAMLLSLGMTALATDLTEEEVNAVLADHGFSAEAIDAIDLADKTTMALQILAGTHSFEENTTVEYFDVNENGSLITPRGNIGLTSSDIKFTISGSKVTEYGVFKYILYYVTCEWLNAPTTKLQDAIAITWTEDFILTPNSFELKSYHMYGSNWVLGLTDDMASITEDRHVADYWQLPSISRGKAQISFKIEPGNSCPETGKVGLNVNYAHKLMNDNISIDIMFTAAGATFSGGDLALGSANHIKEF